nr:hypothetical protein B0A51_12069 [Rachicladosporium sp. CCFEE 5018]
MFKPCSISRPMDQFILFGDSITQQSFAQDNSFAFGAELSNAYVRRLDVVNRGYSGYNTEQALKILPKIIPTPTHTKIRLFTLFFGANDARLPNTPGGPQQNVPLEAYRTNLKSILTHPTLRAHQNVRLMVITAPPVDERMLSAAASAFFDTKMAPNRTAINTAKYVEAAREVAKEEGVVCCDLWGAMMSRAGWRTGREGPLPGSLDGAENEVLQGLLSDGLHFTPSGYKVLYDEVMNTIEQNWPDQMPDRLPFVLPAWDDEQAWK